MANTKACFIASAAIFCGASAMSSTQANAQNVLDEWSTVQAPPPPEVHEVRLDPKTTVLFVMDFNRRNCRPEERSRCAVALPKVAKLLAEARAKGMMVVHSYTPNMAEADISKEVAPAAGERVVQVRGDKFTGNDLEQTLKAKGIKTVLTVGTSANGAVLFTAIGASQRAFKVVVPVDAMPADTAYQEQFSIWEIANGPTIKEVSTLTTLSKLSF